MGRQRVEISGDISPVDPPPSTTASPPHFPLRFPPIFRRTSAMHPPPPPPPPPLTPPSAPSPPTCCTCRAEGAEGSEDELLLWLREGRLITYPSPLLGRLLERLPEVLAAEGAAAAGPRGAHRDRASGAAVAGGGGGLRGPLARGEDRGGCRSRSRSSSGQSDWRLAWARENGCPWSPGTSGFVAEGGNVECCGGRGCTTARGMRRRLHGRQGRVPRGVEVGARAPLPVG